MIRVIRNLATATVVGMVADAACSTFWLELHCETGKHASSLRGTRAATKRLTMKARRIEGRTQRTVSLLRRALTQWKTLNPDDKRDIKERAMLAKDIAKNAYDYAVLVLKGASPNSGQECKELVTRALTLVIENARTVLVAFPTVSSARISTA